MPSIEVRATFKNINIKDKTIMQFELSASSIDKIQELVNYANQGVILTIESPQAELPIEGEYEAIPDDQPPIDFDEALALPRGDDYEEEIA